MILMKVIFEIINDLRSIFKSAEVEAFFTTANTNIATIKLLVETAIKITDLLETSLKTIEILENSNNFLRTEIATLEKRNEELNARFQ